MHVAVRLDTAFRVRFLISLGKMCAWGIRTIQISIDGIHQPFYTAPDGCSSLLEITCSIPWLM